MSRDVHAGDFDGDFGTISIMRPGYRRLVHLESARVHRRHDVPGRSGYRRARRFDGDGRAISVYARRSTGMWRVLPSAGDFRLPLSWARAVRLCNGETTGDARPIWWSPQHSAGLWCDRVSRITTAISITWGSGSSVPGDYDGDGRAISASIGSRMEVGRYDVHVGLRGLYRTELRWRGYGARDYGGDGVTDSPCIRRPALAGVQSAPTAPRSKRVVRRRQVQLSLAAG